MGKTFERSFYSPNLTEGRASVEDINSMLSQFEAIVKEGRRGNGVMMCLFLVFFFGGFALTVTLMNTVFESNASSSAMFLIPLGYMLLFAIFAIMLAKRGRNSILKAKAACQQVIDRNNQFNAVGLRWNLPMSFPNWVELWKDYKGIPGNYPNYQMVPNYNPVIIGGPQYPNTYPQQTGFYAPPPVVGNENQYPQGQGGYTY